MLPAYSVRVVIRHWVNNNLLQTVDVVTSYVISSGVELREQ